MSDFLTNQKMNPSDLKVKRLSREGASPRFDLAGCNVFEKEPVR